jgi:cytochrome c oxidase assembly factor CtaG
MKVPVGLAVALLLLPIRAALAHPGEAAAPHDVWTRWAFEPGVVLPLLLVAVWYAAGARALRRRSARGRAVRTRQAWCWAAGLATIAVALVSPLDAAAEAIFSAHMIQHLLLIVVAAPLLVLGAPGAVLWWGVPERARRSLARAWLRSGRLRGLWRAITAPGVVLALHVFALWLWHFPGPYQLALRNDAVHALEHFCFLATAVLYWWVVLQPSGHRRLGYPATVIYLVVTLIQGGALGAFLVYARTPWYPAHAAGAAAWGMTALEDQQLAGVIMWVPAAAAYVGAAVWALARWLDWDERRIVAAAEPQRWA